MGSNKDFSPSQSRASSEVYETVFVFGLLCLKSDQAQALADMQHVVAHAGMSAERQFDNQLLEEQGHESTCIE